MLFAVLMWLGVAGAVECTTPVSQEELVQALDRTEQALVDLDDPLFRDGVNEIAALLLPCVSDALPTEIAARYHRLMALHLHANGDEEKAQGAVIAARTLAPETGFPPELVPASHPLASVWMTGEADPALRSVPEPKFGNLGFDGMIGRDRPRNRPTVAQVFDESGIAISTQYLGAREPLPTYTAIPRQRNLLLGCAGGAALGAGGTYAAAWAARGSMFRNASKPGSNPVVMDGNRNTTNALAVTSGLLLGVGAGCGAGAVLIGQR